MNPEEARVLLFCGPAGVEQFFREASAFAATVPPGERPDLQTLAGIARRHGRDIGPPIQLRA